MTSHETGAHLLRDDQDFSLVHGGPLFQALLRARAILDDDRPKVVLLFSNIRIGPPNCSCVDIVRKECVGGALNWQRPATAGARRILAY